MNFNMSLPGLEPFIITNSTMKDGIFQLHMELERRPHQCPNCGKTTDRVHDYRLQKIQHTNIFSRETQLFYRKRRYVCRHCEQRFYEENELVDRYQRYSKEHEKSMALELIHGKNFKDTAARFHTSSTTVMRRFDVINAKMLKEPNQLPKVIAIDEYKGDAGGEKYQTIIADPVNRQPLEILPDRKKETVPAYLQQYGRNVEMVVMDMSPSFKAAVDQALGGPVVIADRFHFCRYIYWALDRARINVQKEFHEYDRKKCKRMRHVFYKANEKLSDKQRWYLERYLKMSAYLKRAYQLKEAYRSWFEESKMLGDKDLPGIKNRLYQFYELVAASGITEFQKAITTFKNWQKEILSSFAFGFHNGYIEGINNQTKVIKRNAFGFRRFDRFRLRILLHHQYKHLNIRLG